VITEEESETVEAKTSSAASERPPVEAPLPEPVAAFNAGVKVEALAPPARTRSAAAAVAVAAPSVDAAMEEVDLLVGEQLSFEDEHGVAEFDDEPVINPVARQTALQAPELIFEPQV
jgi:hypothetical protein